MLLVNFIFVFIILIGCISCDDDGHDHHHGNEESILQSIINSLNINRKDSTNHTIFTDVDVDKLVTSLYFRNCSNDEQAKYCNLCYTTSDVRLWYNISKNSTIEEDKFLSITEGLLYLLSNPKERVLSNCSNVTAKKLDLKTDIVYEEILGLYGGKENHSLNEEGVESLLKDINKLFADKLTEKKCFSAHEVIEGSNSSETIIKKENFKLVSGYIIGKLLMRQCIDIHEHKHHENLPKESEFIDDIFEHYGVNNSHMNHESFEKLVKTLNIGGVSNNKKEDGHGHDHRRKRSVENQQHLRNHFARIRRHADGLEQKCYSSENLLEIYHIHEGSLIDKRRFQEICPSLIQQIESGSCNNDSDILTKLLHGDKNYKDWEPWVATILSVLIISIGSMVGIFAAPFTRKPWFPFLIMFLISLAVATLVGDAMLHLFPHSLDLHKHDETIIEVEHDHGNEFLKSESFLWKSVLFLVGISLFLTFEVTMKAFGGGHAHSHGPSGDESPQINPELYLGRRKSLKQEDSKGALRMNEDVIINMNKRESIALPTPSGMLQFIDKKSSFDSENEIHFNSSNQTITVSPSREDLVANNDLSIKNFKSIVWMVLVGDAIHNFMDGVAVGVAFSESWPSGLHGGISTSIAIFCHELPHELGDFAVLLASGLSIKQAILMNFVSSLTAVLGGILGVSMGTKWDASPWIFAATAGLFVYIALADMLPEALNSTSLKQRPWFSFIMIELGMLVGYVIMFCLAAWEEDIKKLIR